VRIGTYSGPGARLDGVVDYSISGFEVKRSDMLKIACQAILPTGHVLASLVA